MDFPKQFPRASIRFIFRQFGCKELVGAEIGVHAADNAKCMMDNLRIKRFYLVDPYITISGHETEVRKKEGEDRMKPYGDRVIWIRDFSVKAIELVKEPLDFAYIDADHKYEAVKQDINLWYPKVKQGGILCGHDWSNDQIGVRKAVEEFALENKLEILEDYDDRQDWVIIKGYKQDEIQKLKELLGEIKEVEERILRGG